MFINRTQVNMCKIKKVRSFLMIVVSFSVRTIAFAQLSAHAGADKTVCPGLSVVLGGSPSATGGTAPYTYSWAPNFNLSSSTIANPSCSPTSYVTYTLTVTDAMGAISTDEVAVSLNYIANVGAGNDINVCANDSVLLGNDLNIAGAGVTYSWSPSTYLNNNTLPRPTCTPTASITYTLTASEAGCSTRTDVITLNFVLPPLIDAGPDITIQLGEVARPIASGAFNYAWYPATSITNVTYGNTFNPDIEPLITTTYYVYGTDPTKTCSAIDAMTVFVLPSDELVFYNTFTPNGDNNNDTWYIGNLTKYPNNKLEIYNRNGKLVYLARGYTNNWDGRAFGEELPAATYYYNLDLGDGKGKKHGNVTIVR